MSRVTNAILAVHVSRNPDDEISSVNEFLRANEVGGGEFRDVTEYAGGHKNLECRVYLSAFNHADTSDIVESVRRAPWRDREMVQLFIKEQEEDLFTLRYSEASMRSTSRIDLAPQELVIMSNALNEICNGIDFHDEFKTRIGASVEEARHLLARLMQMQSSRQ